MPKPGLGPYSCDLRDFLNEIYRTKTSNEYLDPILPAELVGRLTRLANISNNELFYIGIQKAILHAHLDPSDFLRPIYLGDIIKRLEKIEKPAVLLLEEIRAINTDHDSVNLEVEETLCRMLTRKLGPDPLTKVGDEIARFLQVITIAKKNAPHRVSKKRGRPAGTGQAGIAMANFIARMEFSAIAAEGDWTLDKNNGSGSLIEALEELRKYLPKRFLPSSKEHPFASYQRILTRARSDWKSNPFQG